jgi:hypothetical protein
MKWIALDDSVIDDPFLNGALPNPGREIEFFESLNQHRREERD